MKANTEVITQTIHSVDLADLIHSSNRPVVFMVEVSSGQPDVRGVSLLTLAVK